MIRERLRKLVSDAACWFLARELQRAASTASAPPTPLGREIKLDDFKLHDELRVSNFGGGGWTPLSVDDLQRQIAEAGNLALDVRWQATFYARVLRSIRDEQPGANAAVKALAAKGLEVGE